MRSFLGVMALAVSSCGGDTACPLDESPPVVVALVNAETERSIADATVTVGDGQSSLRLMESSRGEYSIWSNVPGSVVTAHHPDYFDGNAELALETSECGSRWIATLEMERKTPCHHGVAGVRVSLEDDRDGVAVLGAELELVDGDYTERLMEMSPGVYEGAYDRPGLYRLGARASGYRELNADGIWVAEDDCSVVTSSVSLKLRRAGI